MPRRREKTRTDWLALALERHLSMGEALKPIQLRSCPAELKETIRRIRALHEQLAQELALALRQDVPPPPRTPRSR